MKEKSKHRTDPGLLERFARYEHLEALILRAAAMDCEARAARFEEDAAITRGIEEAPAVSERARALTAAAAEAAASVRAIMKPLSETEPYSVGGVFVKRPKKCDVHRARQMVREPFRALRRAMPCMMDVVREMETQRKKKDAAETGGIDDAFPRMIEVRR